MDADQKAYLQDMLEAASLILEYTQELDCDKFLEDVKTQDAVLRRFEIIGEAASYLTDETRSLFPDTPFQKMRGMRNLIAHAYGEVDMELVWRTVENHIPALKKNLEDFLNQKGNNV